MAFLADCPSWASEDIGRHLLIDQADAPSTHPNSLAATEGTTVNVRPRSALIPAQISQLGKHPHFPERFQILHLKSRPARRSCPRVSMPFRFTELRSEMRVSPERKMVSWFQQIHAEIQSMSIPPQAVKISSCNTIPSHACMHA
jgi:hypothetical protein